MKINNTQLISELLGITNRLIVVAKDFKTLDLAQLTFKRNPSEWSILECLEHLNLYGDFYLPAIEIKMLAHKQTTTGSYTPGVLGNYFVKLVRVKEKQKKMSTTSDKNPAKQSRQLSPTVIDRFLRQQERLKILLERAQDLDLGKIRTPVSISSLIRLKLGDTLRFVVYHNERHVGQAERMLSLQFSVNSLTIKQLANHPMN
ncbi:DinB family protein [Pedobacter sp. KR3-3]|uniref:DinB family protein n=1 Tax=Pedobacter albus TaxID=3113905 RepID=A0ABU7IA31_9SPHI|nr:DinB family protein [Pedobacter sp. KR3-3]MEE1946335.1 DinB family protein [Pedobacter sp. KR3-3]